MAMFSIAGLSTAHGQLSTGQSTNQNPWLLIPSLDAHQRAEIAAMCTNELFFVPDGLIAQKLRPSQIEEAKEVFDRHPRVYQKSGIQPYLRSQETPSLCWAACLQPILSANGFPISQREIERLILKDQPGQGIVLSNLAFQINSVQFSRIANAFHVDAFYYPFCPEGLGIMRLIQGRYLIVPVNKEHVVMVTGFKTLGFLQNARLCTVEYFEPMDGQIHEWGSNEWESIRTAMPGVLSISAASRFFSGPDEKRYVVKRGERWLYVNSSGTKVVNQEFDSILSFGFGALGRIGSDWYIIQFPVAVIQSPNVVRLGTFEDARGFGFNSKYINVAPAKKGGKWGFINLQGQFVISPQWIDVGFPSLGRTPVESANGLWGYMDDTGGVAIDPRYDAVTPFTVDGKAFVRLHNTWRMIATNGLSCSDVEFEAIGDGGYGCFAGRKDGKWGYYSYSGNPLTQSQFEDVGPYTRMLAPVKEPGTNYGYIDEFGSYRILPKFNAAQPFYSFNRAIVEAEQGWGIIDRTGAFVLKPQYPYLGVGPEGLLIADDWFGQAWYIDERGNRLLAAGFDPLEGKVRGRQRVTLELKGDWAKRDFWFIPQYEWNQRAVELMMTPAARLQYRAKEVTSPNGVLKVFNQIYIVISEKSGHIETNRIDVLPPGPVSFTFDTN
jgi:WG containing repeat